jgi:hypothetical protein
LAHRDKVKDVRFVCVDVWERDTKLAKPFIDEMGDNTIGTTASRSTPSPMRATPTTA